MQKTVIHFGGDQINLIHHIANLVSDAGYIKTYSIKEIIYEDEKRLRLTIDWHDTIGAYYFGYTQGKLKVDEVLRIAFSDPIKPANTFVVDDDSNDKLN